MNASLHHNSAYGRFLSRARRIDFTPLLLVWATAVLYCLFAGLTGEDMLGSSNYNTYTLQALAWRNGRISLGCDYPHLELAIYNNDWFVSFPPVPSIPLYFLTFFFGDNTPDHFLVKFYVLVGVLTCYHMLRKAHYDKVSACAFSLFVSFGSCLMTLTTNGAVWYQAQTMAYMFTMLAVMLMYCEHPTPALFLYALSVGCRPFNVFYALPLFTLYFVRAYAHRNTLKETILRLLPGVILGLCVAAAYAWYNWARFDNPLEFGHNYLPEFSTQGGTQFALKHVAANIRTFLFGLPFSDGIYGIELNVFGFSMFIANSVFILLLIWIIADIARKRFTLTKGAILISFSVHLFCLLLHRTFGGFQFGARYTCDLLPYAAFYLALPGHTRRMRIPECMLLICALAFSFYGMYQVML